jgi:hypothetical protein
MGWCDEKADEGHERAEGGRILALRSASFLHDVGKFVDAKAKPWHDD